MALDALSMTRPEGAKSGVETRSYDTNNDTGQALLQVKLQINSQQPRIYMTNRAVRSRYVIDQSLAESGLGILPVLENLVSAAGFEPATHALKGRRWP